MPFCASIALGERVRTFIPSATGVAQAGSSHYPRLAKLRGDVKLHLEQAQELRLILETLQRDYGQGA